MAEKRQPLSVKGSLRSLLPPLPWCEARNGARFEEILKDRERSFGSLHSLRMTVVGDAPKDVGKILRLRLRMTVARGCPEGQ